MRGVYVLILIFFNGCVGANHKKYYDNFDPKNGLSEEYREEYGQKYKDFFYRINEEYASVQKEYDEKYGEGNGKVVFLREQKEYMTFYEYAEKKQKDYISPVQSKVTENRYCTYFLSFLPLNIWNIGTNEYYVKRLLKESNENGVEGNSMNNISIIYDGMTSPFFSYSCSRIRGVIIMKDE